MFGYGKARLFDGVEAVKREIESAEELQEWMQGLPEIVLEKESADVLVVVFVVEKIGDGGVSRC
ncbi:MAG: hypothetical protein XD40_0723 [Archaeoglobus fulgidus]|jgi:hypothetical protein|uniref:Uncharacterized protein n=1 Tax=Archaeoglobus fulgidus TaxID=2234 RepID=A0A124FC65_ARCFL|nr:hypothetical protein [Archaeoglobus fulgidus]KUJ94129.1 MAG: hypothetical protein XD40_0723 [Archaeoglobus fulgidus]KUK07719.1 MAG: hypothetical protein XD48_0054 [Archaeoglobus fulgidus]